MKKVKRPKNLFVRNGVWVFRARMTINNKLVYVKKSTGFGVDALPEAMTRAAEIETEARKIAHGWQPDVKAEEKKRALTFGEWAERYQKTYSAAKKHPERDAQMLKHALPFFGSKRMNEVTDEDCKAYMLLRAEQGAEAWSVRRERGFLTAI